MPKTTSRQLAQPQLALVLEYNLLRTQSKDSPVMVNLVRENPDLYDFYEVDILTKDPVQRWSQQTGAVWQWLKLPKTVKTSKSLTLVE